MDGFLTDATAENCGFLVLSPPVQRLPVVLASPHSGRDYPADLLLASRLDPHALRRSEDSFVDEIFERAPGIGAPLLKALFPRAYVDANREAFELDPDMFADYLPDYVNTRSPRVAAGLGTIARVVGHGQEIYAGKLRFEDALRRIDGLYRPYHRTLRGLIDDTVDRFGHCLLLDCHSMPTAAGAGDRRPRFDFVLGDSFGSACSPTVIATAERWLRGRGYRVARNTPYAGGFTTCHYGQPDDGVHALQIEIGRNLYMDETRMVRKTFLATLKEQMADLIGILGDLDLADRDRRQPERAAGE